MFLRWKKRTRRGTRWARRMGRAPEEILAAYLVEAYRDKAGRPRQRQTYLAQIPTSLKIGPRLHFWERAVVALTDLAPSDRKRIAARLTERVPPPTAKERREREAFLASLGLELRALARGRVVPRKAKRATDSAALRGSHK